MINSKSKYKISQIVNLKINYKYVYKLLYKVISLEYKNIKEKSDWLSTSKLAYISEVVCNLYLTYSNKPCLLLLS